MINRKSSCNNYDHFFLFLLCPWILGIFDISKNCPMTGIFDSVSHPVLLKKLNACVISGQFHQYIQSYLENQTQFTVINGVSSKEEKFDFGVPQGNPLGSSLLLNQCKQHERPHLVQSLFFSFISKS